VNARSDQQAQSDRRTKRRLERGRRDNAERDMALLALQTQKPRGEVRKRAAH